MILSSPAFRQGAPIPKKFTGEGEDISPPLKWSDIPQGTAELVLIAEDPDAPQPEPWVHWLVYALSPSGTNGIPEALPKEAQLNHPLHARQGRTTFGKVGYGGPMPPSGHGTHRYYFRLYALKIQLDLPSSVTKEELVQAMQGHVLAEAVLMGTYERTKAQAA